MLRCSPNGNNVHDSVCEQWRFTVTLGKCTQLPNHILRHQNMCESSTLYQLMSLRYVDTLICHVSVFSQQCSVIQRALGSRSEDLSPGSDSHTSWPCACRLTLPSVTFLIFKLGLVTPALLAQKSVVKIQRYVCASAL